MIYLKTIFSAPHEIKYLKLNLREAFNHIDKFIICEFNRTHIGNPRNLIFHNYISQFSPEEQAKIIYLGADISEFVTETNNSTDANYKNECWFRGYFAKKIHLNDNDIIFSVDADEIIFEHFYPKIIRKLHWPWNTGYALPMHQFFYKINYLWENFTFKSAVACKAKAFNKIYPAHWRDYSKLYPEIVGCHFSWCMSVDEMLQKLANYSHHHDYAHLAQREILEHAIKTKTYPFDPLRPFNIKTLNTKQDEKYYPKSLENILSDFEHLIEKNI